MSSFLKDDRTRDGHGSWCQSCRREYKKSPRQLALAKVAKKAHRNKHYEHYRNKERVRELKKYGLTIEDYNKLLKGQNNCCAICGVSESEFKRRLHVDHDHTTGLVRELLCSHCNTVLGKVKDSIETLQKMQEYLKKHRSKG